MMDSKTAVGDGAVAERNGDYAIALRHGAQLVISEDGEGNWPDEIGVAEVAMGAADTLVNAIWKTEDMPQEVAAIAIVRLFDRLGEDAVKAAIGPVDAALFKMLGERDEARAMFVLETVEKTPLFDSRREILARLLATGLDRRPQP